MSGGGDLEQGGGQRRSTGGACFSDADEGYGFGESEVGGGRRGSSVSECSVVVVAAEESEAKVARVVEAARECRICQLGLESNSEEFGAPMELGCSCKEDLGSAHKHCAEVWFKIKGDKTCEICHSIARNVVGAAEVVETFEQSTNEGNTSTLVLAPTTPASETRSFWHGHRFLNFLLACMVFAFVISWLFHFNVPSN